VFGRRGALAATSGGWMAWERTVYNLGAGTGEVGETAETGESPEGEEEAVVVSTLPVLHVSHAGCPCPCPLPPEIAQVRLEFEF
jgi:hypothetical protein